MHLPIFAKEFCRSFHTWRTTKYEIRTLRTQQRSINAFQCNSNESHAIYIRTDDYDDDDDDDVVEYYVRKTRKLFCDSFTAFIALVVVIRKSEHVLKVHIPVGGVMIRWMFLQAKRSSSNGIGSKVACHQRRRLFVIII